MLNCGVSIISCVYDNGKRTSFSFSTCYFFLFLAALDKDEEMAVDSTQLSTPHTPVRKMGKLAFIIDPFNKTNDANRTNNVLFATINLQTSTMGELPDPHTSPPPQKVGLVFSFNVNILASFQASSFLYKQSAWRNVESIIQSI